MIKRQTILYVQYCIYFGLYFISIPCVSFDLYNSTTTTWRYINNIYNWIDTTSITTTTILRGQRQPQQQQQQQQWRVNPSIIMRIGSLLILQHIDVFIFNIQYFASIMESIWLLHFLVVFFFHWQFSNDYFWKIMASIN